MRNTKRFLYVVIITNFICLSSPSLARDFTLEEYLYPQLVRNIVRLECRQEYRNYGDQQISVRNLPIGTGFFVEYENPSNTDNILFVVTARHVAENPCDLHARVQIKDLITGRIETKSLKINRSRWIFHPSYGDNSTNYVDVAATRIKFIKDKEIIAFKYNPNDIIKSNLPNIDPMPPWPVLVFGFPGKIGLDLKEQRPIGRFGIISMIAGEKFLKIDNKFVDQKAYIIDCSVFGGNSGGPVINQIVPIGSDKVILWGLVIMGSDDMRFAVVEPVSRIRETIEKAKEQPESKFDNWFSLE